MSIKVSSLVWDCSGQKSGKLLLLLAIADHANEQGVAWPGIPLLARKTRLCERREEGQTLDRRRPTGLTRPAESQITRISVKRLFL